MSAEGSPDLSICDASRDSNQRIRPTTSAIEMARTASQ